MPKTKIKTTIRLKVFKPTNRMYAYMIHALTLKDEVVIDANIFFQDLRQTEKTAEELFYSYCKSLSPRVKKPLTSKKFVITIAGEDEHRLKERDSFYNKYNRFMNKDNK